MTCLPRRRWMMRSRPTKAPPQMNRMSLVSTRMYSCCGCLRPPCGGTLQTVPSRIFSKRLLHAFAGDIARDGDVLGLAGDLVDLVDVNDAALGALHVVIGVLQQAQDDVLDVLAHVAGLGQRGGVGDGERHVQDLRQRAGQQGLARAGRADHQDVALLDLDVGVRVGGRRLVAFRRRRRAVPGGCACNGCAPRRPASSWRAPGRCSARSSWRLISAGLGTLTRGLCFLACGGEFLVEDLLAEDDAVVADVNARARR